MRLHTVCPAASVLIACIQWMEPSGVDDLKGAVLTVEKNGVQVLSQTLAASSPKGEGTQAVSIPTVPCEKATYTATLFAEYMTSGKSIPVTASVVKDRTSECPPPPPPPPPPAGGLKITSQTPDAIIIECTKEDCPNGVTTSTAGSTKDKAVRTVKKK